MPLDARIPLTVNQPQPFDLGAVMDQAAKIEAAKLKRQQMIDGAADDAAIATALKSASGPQGVDYEAAINALAHRPAAMMHLQTQVDEHRKKSADALKVQLDNDAAEARILSQWAGTITDQPSLDFAKRVLSPEMAKFLPEQWDDQAASVMQQIAQGGMTASEKVAARKLVLDEWQASQKTNEDDRKALLGYLSVVDTPEEWDQTLKSAAQMGVSPRVIATLPAQFSPEAAELVRQQVIGPAKLADLQQGAQHNAAIEANAAQDNRRADAQLDLSRQRLALDRQQEARMAAAAKGGPLNPADAALVEKILENPAMYNDLTPSRKGELMAALAARDFVGFGKPLTDAAIGKIAETKSAMQSLKDLRDTLKENEQYIGPIAGMAAMNPYSSARQAQAKIDLVRQRVGKALEGGVLRKEDEEKYKKILATLRDTPETAIFKVDNLIETLGRDMETFIQTQQQAGRNIGRVDTGQTPAGQQAANTGATVKMRAPDGTIKDVPADQVAHYTALGAKVIK